MAFRVTAPVADYEGQGPGGAYFQQGVGYTTDQGVLGYYRAHGYQVAEVRDSEVPKVPAFAATEGVARGPASRDAAVVSPADGPNSDAWLPPSNVGDDPHGPTVVSPGLHAVPPAPIRPGTVAALPAVQESHERQLADRVLVEGASVADAMDELADGERTGGEMPEGPDAADPSDTGTGVDLSLTVEEVAERAEQLDADAIRRLIDEEHTGSDRKTLLERLEQLAASKES